MKKQLLEIFEHFGPENQRNKLCEEFRELQDELFMVYVLGAESDNLISEIADMIILILEFAYEYGYNNDEIIEQIQYKVDRTLKRIEEGYYDNNSKQK